MLEQHLILAHELGDIQKNTEVKDNDEIRVHDLMEGDLYDVDVTLALPRHEVSYAEVV